MTKRIYLHVGAPATGGRFLRRALWGNRRRLGDNGVCYPFGGPQEHFGATMDLREMSWGGRRDPAWDGAWNRMVERVHDWGGPTVVLTEPLLAGASEEQARRAVASLEPAEVHIVFSTRALGWQLLADWQEQIRHGHAITFDRFTDDLVANGDKAAPPFGGLFWGLHDAPRALGPWARAAGADRVHVITLPAPGARPGVLWSRYCALTGIDPALCDVGGLDEDAPLTTVEAELLRRLNERIGPMLGGDYERVVGEYLLKGGLAAAADQVGRHPMTLPERHQDWARREGARVAEAIRAADYDVVGDLEELGELRLPAAGRLPDQVPEALVSTASVGVVAHLLERLTQSHERIGLAHLNSQLTGVRENLDRLLEAAGESAPALQRATRRVGRRTP
ncbi:hypothetical protein [Actinomadura hibisca]|uniref:hypothetical protein n=1 Tax=Actinomadura hibisca TaxID=68565 RepID=UPI00082BBD64|nr:hypothetical protein [Actinomadura hibisca]